MDEFDINIVSINTMSDSQSETSEVTMPTLNTVERDLAQRETKRLKLIEKYGSNPALSTNKSTLTSINRAVRRVLLPRMKFLSTSKSFGSFDQPDFTDPNCWIHKVFAQLGSFKDASDGKKAEVWMTYRAKIREQFGLHRSAVTLGLKKTFIKGM